MSEDLYGLIKEMVSRIHLGTLGACRNDIARSQTRLNARPGPWSELRSFVDDNAAKHSPDLNREQSVGEYLLKTAASRFLDNMVEAGHREDIAALRSRLRKRVNETHMACRLLSMSTGNGGVGWEDLNLTFPDNNSERFGVRIGTLKLSCEELRQAVPELDWDFHIPAILPFEQGRPVCLIAPGAEREKAVAAVESVAFRLLLGTSPGRMRLLILDPLGTYIGILRSLPGLQFVASGPVAVESAIAEVLQHIEKSTTSIASNDLPDRSYGQKWGLLGIDCDHLSARVTGQIQAVMRNGRKIGVYTLLHWSDRTSEFERKRILDLSSGSSIISWNKEKRGFVWDEEGLDDCTVELDTSPSDDLARNILLPVSEACREKEALITNERLTKRNPKLTFSQLLVQAGLQEQANWWKEESTNQFEGLLGLEIDNDEIGGPIACRFGRGSEHALLAGVTASGKNNLLNVLIASLAIRYSPEELEFFMIDLKEGVEFQRFARCGLPHARVISLSNDPEFALNVLRGLKDEMEVRGALFTASGVTNIADYRKKTGKRLSRILLVVDEAKTLYAGYDAGFALAFFDEMAAKGRAFGLHLLLSNQGFSGSSLKLSTMANMGIRIVTKGKGSRTCENVLESNNAALDSLMQYEVVYNDGLGSKEYNHVCRVPLWSDSDDAVLLDLRRKASAQLRKPIIFHGQDQPLLSSCADLNNLPLKQNDRFSPKMWIGAPMSLQESISVEWRRESKQNCLVVDTNEERTTSLIVSACVSLLKTLQPSAGQILIHDFGTTNKNWSRFLASVATASGKRIVQIQEIQEELRTLSEIVEKRRKNRMYGEPSLFFVLNGIHHFREFHSGLGFYGQRTSSENTKSINELLGSILKDGPYVGVHAMVWCDTAENVRRLLEPGKLRAEFGIVIAGKQPDDIMSRALVGNGKAATLGVNRMVLANSGSGGDVSVFRPYAIPDMQWLEATAGSDRLLQ